MVKSVSIFFLIFSSLFLFSPDGVCSQASDEEANNYHRHLPKDVPFMKKVFGKWYDYEVDSESFDKIHPPLLIDNSGFKASAGQIECPEPDKSYGSGTLTKLNKNGTSEILTAKHVVTKDGKALFPTFYQGRTTTKDGRVSHLAKYEIDEVCFNPNNTKDIALLKGKIVEDNMGEDLYKTPSIIRSKASPYDDKEEKSMNHYPFSTYTQRYNTGTIEKDGTHTISSLPGSSGAGGHNSKQELEYVHSSAKEPLSSHKRVFYNLPMFNGYLSGIQATDEIVRTNRSYPIHIEEINDFKQCFSKNYKL